MRIRTKIAWSAAAALVAAAVSGLMLNVAGGRQEPMQLEEVAELVWPDGMEMHYQLVHTAQSRATLSLPAQDGSTREKDVDGETALSASLVIEPSVSSNGTRLRLRLQAVSEARVEVMGQNAVPAAVEFERHTAVVDLSPGGAIRELRFSQESPELYRNMMQVVLADLQANVQRGHSWRVDERTMHGVVSSRYDASGSKLQRTRRVFVDGTRGAVRGDASFGLDEHGYVSSVSSTETVSLDLEGGAHVTGASDTRITLISVQRRVERAPVATTRAYHLGELATTNRLQRQHGESRIAGLTPEAMLEILSLHAAAGRVPDHNRFLWQATGLLAANPELCDDLVAVFERADMSAAGHRLIVDLLVGAGTPSAQAAMRVAIGSGAANRDSDFGMLYQRFGLLSAPDRETMEFVRARYRGPGAEGADAAAHAYGAVVGRRVAAKDDHATEAAWSLARDMNNAETPRARAQLLGALGNVRLLELEPHIAVHLQDESPTVRRAAASALRHIPTYSARDSLVELTDDSDGTVQRRALASLAGRSLTNSHFDRLSGGVDSGKVLTSSLDPLLDIAQGDLDRAEAQQLLMAIATRRSATKQQRARARSMMALER